MLPMVTDYDAEQAAHAASHSNSISAINANLLPTIQSFRSYVAKIALQERNITEQESRKEQLSTSPQNASPANVWGDHGRTFEIVENGCALYIFRYGETLRSVVTDLLTESRKTNSKISVDYATIRSASAEILSYNNIHDADLIDGGNPLLIPPSLLPAKYRQ